MGVYCNPDSEMAGVKYSGFIAEAGEMVDKTFSPLKFENYGIYMSYDQVRQLVVCLTVILRREYDNPGKAIYDGDLSHKIASTARSLCRLSTWIRRHSDEDVLVWG